MTGRLANLSEIERARRLDAAVQARHAGALHQGEQLRRGDDPPAETPSAGDTGLGSQGTGAAPRGDPPGDPLPPDSAEERPEPDYPVVTIAIGGPAASGKSVLAHVIRSALAREGVAFEGPPGLPTRNWHRALLTLGRRGLSVVITERDC